MQKIHLETFIKAPKKKVWDYMLSEKTYREWTKAFSEGSHFVGSWDKGSKMLFLGPDPETGKEMGMVSRIKESKPHDFVSIEHLGIFANGVEDTTSEIAKAWAPAFENYTFKEKDGGTELVIDMDISESEKMNMENLWKNALKLLKEQVENNQK